MAATRTSYAWFADDELLVMLNRYVERAPSSELASTRLKVWLAQQCLPPPRSAIGETLNSTGKRRRSPNGATERPTSKRKASSTAGPSQSTVVVGVADAIPGRVRMTRREAAVYLDRARSTLANWAHRRVGPPYYRKGGVHYFKDELDAWLARPEFDGD